MAEIAVFSRQLKRFRELTALVLLLAVSACGGGASGDAGDGGGTAQDVTQTGVLAAVAAFPASGTAPLTSNLDGSGSWALDGSALTYDWDFDGNGVFEKLDGSATESYTWEQAGTYNVALRVFDSSGRFAVGTVKVVVSPGTGDGGNGGDPVDPVAQISVWPRQGAAPLEVTLDASGCWARDGGALSFEYDYEGDGKYDLKTTEVQTTHIYAEGSYTPTVRATDSAGHTATASQAISVSVGTGGGGSGEEQGPIAVLLATPVYGAPPLAVSLDASASVALGAAVAGYDWDMDGDGEFELLDAGPTQSATYTSEGLFYVYVRVNDADGLSGTGQAAIVVSASL